MPVGQPEFAENPEPRCPCVLLLDTSGSMAGNPIDELNAGLSQFKSDLEADPIAQLRVEVAIVTFGGVVRKAHDWATVEAFNPPTLSASGETPMGQAIMMSLDMIEERKKTYKANGVDYFRPWIFLITDGAPTDAWEPAAQRVHSAESGKQAVFFAVGVQKADMNTLTQISPPSRKPLLLQGVRFQDLFIWLSRSLQQVSSSKPGGEQVALPTASGWGTVVT